MRERTSVTNSIENINSVNRYRENLSILKWIDESNFDKLVKSFWSEKEENKILLSWFLNSTNVSLAKLWDMTIDINNIKNYIRNKPDISKDLEIKIAKLFVKKLYESWCTNIPFVSDIKQTFDIKDKADIENKTIDFQTIQVNIQNLEHNWNEKIDSVTISNDEIFDLIKHDINKYANFESQNISAQPMILDILQFEMKGIINYIKQWWEKAEQQMWDIVLPVTNTSEIFDEVADSEIQQLRLQKSGIDEILKWGEKGIATKNKTFWKDYIKDLEQQWLSEDYIRKLKNLLLWSLSYSILKNHLKNRVGNINKKIWRKYIENFEKAWKSPEFIAVLKKFYSNWFDFSKLDKNEQTILRQTLILNKFNNQENSRAKYAWLDQDEVKEFLKDLYDFEKNETTIDIDDVWKLNLRITKEIQWWENNSFSDPEKFKDMGTVNPIKFTVNIDNNDENIIKDLEEAKDSPLRSDWIIETHITKWWELNIWNWYKLEICGKTITKSQLDQLLECDYNEDELNKKLKELWLYDELKDSVISVKRAMFNPQNVFYDYDENWVAQNNDHWYWPYWYRFCIFEEVLKNLDVKILERNLIFEWENIDKLNQLYLMSKLWYRTTKGQQDSQINTLLDAARDEGEGLGNAEVGKENATALWDLIKADFLDNNVVDEDVWVEYQIDGDVANKAQEYRDQLSQAGKAEFSNTLRNLCDNDSDLWDEEKSTLSDAIDDLIEGLELSQSQTDIDNNTPKESVDKEKTEEEMWREAWDSLWWDQTLWAKNSENDKREEIPVWTRLYCDLWESELPPKGSDTDGTCFYCFEITNVWDKTFTLKAIWWELKSSLTGNEYILDKTKDQLESLKKWWNVFKVRPRDSVKWEDCLESINKAWMVKKFTAFWNITGQVQLKWDKFVKKVVNEKWEEEEVEVKYFTNYDFGFDDSNEDKKKWWQWEKILKYEIKKIDTKKWTVKLASTFDWYDNYKDVTYKYENEITFEQFILLIEWKKLKWCTENQEKELETKYAINDPKRLATKWQRKRISIWSIINIFKNSTKWIKAKMDDRKKQQDEDLENYLFSQEWLNLYWKLWWLFWNTSLGDASRKMQYEFYTNRENRTWKRIEERYKIFDTDPQYSEFFWDHLYPILNKDWYIWDDKDRYKFAAAFLVMVKNEWPYPRQFANKKDTWKRVENILWPEHKTRFLNFYEKKKAELIQEKDLWHQSWARLALQEELNKMEINYIISTIDWRAPYGPSSNEYMLKSIWSKKFMSQLEENVKWYYNWHSAEKDKLETYYSAEEAYLRNIWSWKFQKALPALERMCETAKTPSEVFRIKWYLLWAMLMWIIKNNSSVNTIKSFWWTCRSMWFTPGYWMRDIEQQDKVKILLDWITNNEFSNNQLLKYKVSNFEPGNIKDGSYSFWRLFQSYWNSHGEDILKKIENPPYKKNENDKSIIDLANEKNNPNNYIFKDIIKNSTTNEIDSTNSNVKPIFAQESPLTATSNMIMEYIPSSGSYKPKNPEDISQIEDFWKEVKACIPSWASDKETTWFLFKKYFNWFNRSLTPNDKQMIVKALPLINEEKNLWHTKEAYFMLWYMVKWILHSNTSWSFPEDFENVINKFVDFFFDNMWYIDQSLVKETFTDKEVYSAFATPYKMVNWSKYLDYNMTDTKWIYSTEKNNYTKSMNYYLNKNNISEENIINKKIDHIWSGIHNKCTVPDKLKWSTAWEDFPIMTAQQLKQIKEQNLLSSNNYDYAIPA